MVLEQEAVKGSVGRKEATAPVGAMMGVMLRVTVVKTMTNVMKKMWVKLLEVALEVAVGKRTLQMEIATATLNVHGMETAVQTDSLSVVNLQGVK